MSLADRPSTLPESVYVTPDTEWSVLLTLAGAANPAELIATGQWFEALFASEQAQTAFRRLAQSSASLALQVPSAMDGVAAFAEPAALQTARQMLVAFAQFRRLETIQANLAREVRRLASSRRIQEVRTLLDAARTALRTVPTGCATRCTSGSNDSGCAFGPGASCCLGTTSRKPEASKR